MADNIAITAGTGTTIKTDDVAGVHYQQVKLVDGTLEATAAIAADVGVKANALRVVPANDITDATYIGDIKFGEALPSGTALLGKVGIDQATANANEVVVKSGTVTVVTSITNAVAVTNAPLTSIDGKMVSGTDIGDVTINNASGAAAVNVQDGGNTITVDGTVAVTNAALTSIDAKLVTGTVIGDVNLGATDNAVLDTIDAVLDTINAKLVTGTVIGDVNLGATDNAVLDTIDAVLDTINAKLVTGTDIGDVTINNASGASAVNVQDGGNALTVDGTVTASNTAGDIASDSADSGNPVKVGGKAVNMDGTVPGTAVAEADRANFITDLYGRQCVETVHPNFWSVSANYSSAQTAVEVVAAPGAGLSLYITDVVCSNGAVAGNMKFGEDTASLVDKIEVMYFAINGGAALHFRTPIKLTANKNFGLTSVTCTTHSVTVNGYTAP